MSWFDIGIEYLPGCLISARLILVGRRNYLLFCTVHFFFKSTVRSSIHEKSGLWVWLSFRQRIEVPERANMSFLRIDSVVRGSGESNQCFWYGTYLKKWAQDRQKATTTTQSSRN